MKIKETRRARDEMRKQESRQARNLEEEEEEEEKKKNEKPRKTTVLGVEKK